MLGAGTAFLGPKAAMTCTQAVEEVIDEHYESQAKQLGDDENELRAVIEEFRKDEQAHRDKAIEEGAEETPGHKTLSRAIKGGTKLAIWLSKKFKDTFSFSRGNSDDIQSTSSQAHDTPTSRPPHFRHDRLRRVLLRLLP